MKFKAIFVILILITIVSLSNVVAEDTNDFYVSVDGDDSNTGEVDSPFATIEKAISSSNPLENNVIYLSSGEFTGSGNNNLNIDGGNFTLIGQGTDNTIINGEFTAPIFNSISSSSFVKIQGISFVNGYARNGGAIQSNSNLKISDCLFENNYAYGNAGGAIYWQNYGNNNITIENTNFIENQASYSGGAVYIFGLSEFNLINCYFYNNQLTNDFSSGSNVYASSWYSNIIGNTFENTTTTSNSFDGGVYLYNRLNGNIINNEFINCVNGGNKYCILYLDGNNYLKDNDFINSYTEMGQIYNDGNMNVIMGVSNFTIDNAPKDINLSVLITDINENIVSGGTVSFYVDNQLVNTTTLLDSEAMVSYLVNNYKNYDILVKYNNQEAIGNIVVLSKKNSTTSLSYINNSNGTVTIVATVDADEGNVTFDFNGNYYVRSIVDGFAFLTTEVLMPGNYEVVATYGGSNEYNSSNDKLNFIINSSLSNNVSFIKLYVDVNNYNKNATIVAICSGNGTVIFTVNGDVYKKDVVDNEAILELNDLEDGNYIVTGNYSGNEVFNASNNSTSFYMGLYKLTSNNITLYYRNGTYYQVKLTYDNQPVSNVFVIILINGVGYNVKTNDYGIAKLSINLRPGVYDISSKYGNLFCMSKVTVLSTLKGDNLVKYFRNNSQYVVNVFDGKGNSLNGGYVKFNINGVIYSKIISNGKAELHINLLPGDYIITTEAINGELFSNNIKVLPIIVDNYNLVKFYKNGSKYSVKVLDESGNPIGGQTVTFNINGIFYSVTSNNDGIAKLSINLNPGKYIITAMYNGFAASNIITVLSTIKSSDLFMTTTNRHPFEVIVLDGQGRPVNEAYVSFNINGIFYNEVSNELGIAKLNINLIAGTYIVTTEYNGLMQSNYIVIRG